MTRPIKMLRRRGVLVEDEAILTHPGLDPQPPPRVRAREAGQD
jgi:hypothetical protein